MMDDKCEHGRPIGLCTKCGPMNDEDSDYDGGEDGEGNRDWKLDR